MNDVFIIKSRKGYYSGCENKIHTYTNNIYESVKFKSLKEANKVSKMIKSKSLPNFVFVIALPNL